jgi:hypothetical protein
VDIHLVLRAIGVDFSRTVIDKVGDVLESDSAWKSSVLGARRCRFAAYLPPQARH